MNRVNFKGVVEKDELLKHVARLWKQEHKAQQGNISFHEIFVKILTVFFSIENREIVIWKFLTIDTNPNWAMRIPGPSLRGERIFWSNFY